MKAELTKRCISSESRETLTAAISRVRAFLEHDNPDPETRDALLKIAGDSFTSYTPKAEE
jgi:hypothetical protein